MTISHVKDDASFENSRYLNVVLVNSDIATFTYILDFQFDSSAKV